MKTNLLLLTIIVLLTACNSTKNQKKELPFVVQEANYYHWYGGQEGITGINIDIVAKSNLAKDAYKTLYYLDKKAAIQSAAVNDLISLKINIDTSTRRDRNLSINKEEEYGNKAPIKLKYPNLLTSEAVVEYVQNGTLKHVKVTLVKKEALYYP